MNTILLCHENQRFCELARMNFAMRGITAIDTSDVALVPELASQSSPQVIVCHIDDEDHWKIYRALAIDLEVPILVLLPKASSVGSSYTLRANDAMITSPFTMERLLTSVQQLLHKQLLTSVITVGGGQIVIDRTTQHVSVRGDTVELTQTEYELLLALAESPGATVYTEALFKQVWGNVVAKGRKYVQVYMTHLRRKVEQDRHRPSLILTEGRLGYKIVA